MSKVSKENKGIRLSGSRSEAIQVARVLNTRKRLLPEGIAKKEFLEKREENMRRDIR